MVCNNLAREFIRKHKESIICEPSGRSYAELEQDRVRKILLVENTINELPLKKNKEVVDE